MRQANGRSSGWKGRQNPTKKPGSPSLAINMTDGPRQRGSTSGSAKDAAGEKESGGGVALKKEIGLVSACGIIVGKSVLLSLLLEPQSAIWCD